MAPNLASEGCGVGPLRARLLCCQPRPRGGDNHTQAIALWSLFGYLKTRKRIFANPASRWPANIGRHHNIAQRYADAVYERHDLAASGYARQE
jgi:hypothetical protein